MDKVTETVRLFDYAHPTMMAERAIRALHDAALARDWSAAQRHALAVMACITEVHTALAIMENREIEAERRRVK